MKHFFYFILCSLLFAHFSFANKPPKEPQKVIEEMYLEMETSYQLYLAQLKPLDKELLHINAELQQPEITTYEKMEAWVRKNELKEQKKTLLLETQLELTKIRYIKGLSVIKSLYEKVLALDHHFASVQTFSEINKIANPNHYPEFDQMKDWVKSKRDKKLNLNLTGILGQNVFASVTQTFINLMGADVSSNEKQENLRKVECILDFTLRMHNDLNTIYFETQFLRASNDEIKHDIEQLFKDYTKPIKYLTDLHTCRTNDDWDEVRSKLNLFLDEIEKSEGNSKYKMQVNLEFSVDRLLQFIHQYNAFIDQGEKFYEKFSIILNSYENEQQCESQIPIEYKKLKQDINLAIEKFKIAYKPVEVNGSKLKEILYGINQFE